MTTGFVANESVASVGDVSGIIAPSACFADAEAKVSWERSYPDVLLAYYSAVVAVACRTCRGGCGVVDGADVFVGASRPFAGQTVGDFGASDSGRGTSNAKFDSGGLSLSGVVTSWSCAPVAAGARSHGGKLGDACRVGGSGCKSVDNAVSGGDGGLVRDGGNVATGSSPEIRLPGKWAVSNRRKKLNRKNRGVPEWRRNAAPVGFCETVVSDGSIGSSCPSYGQALSDAERQAKESLARRRAAENALKEKLAKLKLAELEDEKRCAEIADLKHQRIIQWTNEATAKSQQSLDKVKSIDPSSSASQYEIRQQAKKLADAEAEVRRVSSIVKTLSPDWQELLERKAESTFNTEYVDELMALGAAGRDNGFNY